MINYDHSANLHTAAAPAAIVQLILDKYSVDSVLDVGCGTGIWLKEFTNQKVLDVYGIDGIPVNNREFNISNQLFRCVDLRSPWDLGRKFDLALCLEVAEHLPASSAHELVSSISNHADVVVFSAACPNQGGQGHINCQWPEYWQNIFNSVGFSCSDKLRLSIWQADFPEYWYKQNIFIATKDAENAGKEDRLLPLVHPRLLQGWVTNCEQKQAVLNGDVGLRKSISMASEMILNAGKSALRRRINV
jgi:SAM-dependent methyltransferase